MAKPSPSHAGDHLLVGLGGAIRAARIGSDLSQESLAVDAGLDRSYVGGIERGEHNITIVNIKKIADALGTHPSNLLRAAGY